MIARSSEVFTAYRHAPYHGMTDDCPKQHYITSSILYVKIASLVGRVSDCVPPGARWFIMCCKLGFVVDVGEGEFGGDDAAHFSHAAEFVGE